MAPKRTYLQEAHDYYEEQIAFMAARVPRSLIIKGTTLLALGGAGAVQAILAACAAGGASTETVAGTSAEGSYKYSKYPFIE